MWGADQMFLAFFIGVSVFSGDQQPAPKTEIGPNTPCFPCFLFFLGGEEGSDLSERWSVCIIAAEIA